ncbi:MAG TPA: septum formation initiator family protein [Candidatus Cloacimonadota bacterium]|nr:septum formation initiator family protein [Candidatus Cloacimonadota bacterium]
MSTRIKKKPKYHKLYNLIFWVLLIIAVLWLLFFSESSFYKANKIRKKMETLEQEMKVLQAQNDSLREENHRLRTDPKAAEVIAREKFGLTKENETKYIFFPSSPAKKDK